MAVKDIFDAVVAELETAAVTVSCVFGGDGRKANAAPPRIVWDVRGGPGGPPGSGNERPRHLRTRNVRVDVLVWGTDAAQAESLLNSLIAAIHRCAVGSYSFDNEEWLEANNEILAKGTAIVATVTFRIPIVDVIASTATITSTELDAGLE